MIARTNFRRFALLGVVAMLLALAVAWMGDLFPKRPNYASANAIMVIAPYRHAGTWVFDDPRTKLVREPFVAGVPEMIDVLVKDIPEASDGFRLLF